MFVGHAAVAFAVSARLAARESDRRRALLVGLVAAAFATLPDVDMLYAPVGLLGARLDALALAEGFWSASTVVHRGVTHSLVVSALVGVVAVAWFVAVRSVHEDGGPTPPVSPLPAALALALGVALVVGVGVDAGALGGAVTAAFVAGAGAVATAAARRTGVGTGAFAGAAAVGLLSHPFGDLFTGTPPAFLYPFDVVVVPARVTLAADPTLHLLAAGGVELLALWAAAAVLVSGSGRRPRDLLSPRVGVAAGYAVAVFLLPPPTLDLSYPFVLSVVAVGAVGTLPRVDRRAGRLSLPDRAAAALSALSAVTVAWVAYGVAYLVV
jgi:membrane-bound metal-dependent hydrolase YbcI (DUF457 family)